MLTDELTALIPAEAYEAVVNRIRPLLLAVHNTWCSGGRDISLVMDDTQITDYGVLEVSVKIHNIDDDTFGVSVGIVLNAKNVVSDDTDCRMLAEAFAGGLGAQAPRITNRRFVCDVPAAAITAAA